MEDQPSKPHYVIHGQPDPEDSEFHSHPVGQLLFAEKGLIHIDYPERKIVLPMQFCSWIPPFKAHRIWSSDSSAFIRAIYFDSHFCQHSVFTQDAVFPLSTVLKEMIRYTAKWHGDAEVSIYETTFLTAIRQMLPGEMAGLIQLEIPLTSHPRLRPILDYIASHSQENLQVAELGRRFGVSARTLHRLFTNELGQSFTAYLMFFRLIRAVELLSAGTPTIKEVAYEIGYSSIPSFSKLFKTVTGESPQQFVRRMKSVSSR